MVLAFANGTTKYKTGEGVIVAPGCTYANWEFYPAIYQVRKAPRWPIGWGQSTAVLSICVPTALHALGHLAAFGFLGRFDWRLSRSRASIW